MVLTIRDYLQLTILIRISIGSSSALTWNPSIHRYESYDLMRGPVFYQAYYPDNNEETRNNLQEKRYFDQDAVLEKSYQVPASGLGVPIEPHRAANYQYVAERYHHPNPYVDPILSKREEDEERGQPSDSNYNSMNNYMFEKSDTTLDSVQDDRLSDHSDTESLNIKEISNLARKAISRDLENWKALENYLDRTKYQESAYQERTTDPGYDDFVQPWQSSLKDKRGSSESLSRIPSPTDPSRLIRKLTPRDLARRDPHGIMDPTQYNDRQFPESSEQNLTLLKRENFQNRQGSIVDSYPSENIFQPRPQIINYVFSKKLSKLERDKVHGTETKDTLKQSMPRNYGDNLIQEEMKKPTKDKDKDVKIASLEISEVPRHKIRHHHGEWPKRDYSHRHQP